MIEKYNKKRDDVEDDDFDIAPTQDENKEDNEQNETHQNAEKVCWSTEA